MISGKFLSVIVLFALFKSFSFQVVLNRALLQQLLGADINNRAYYLNQKGIKDIDPNTFNGLTQVEESYCNRTIHNDPARFFMYFSTINIEILKIRETGFLVCTHLEKK
jgi:hypothetical protein